MGYYEMSSLLLGTGSYLLVLQKVSNVDAAF